MNRRGFLSGVIGGIAAATGTALVRLADPKEVTLLTEGKPVALVDEVLPPASAPWRHVGLIAYAKSKDGSFEPLGYITSVNVHQDIAEYATFDGEIVYVPGLKRGEIKFAGRLK